MNQKHDNSQWPPPPDFGPNADVQTLGLMTPARLMTGSAWGDAAFGIVLSVVLFTLLLFALVNPLTALVLPLATKVPIGLRLLGGWALAGVVQYAVWRLCLLYDFQAVGNSILLTALPTALIWLSLSSLAWAFG